MLSRAMLLEEWVDENDFPTIPEGETVDVMDKADETQWGVRWGTCDAYWIPPEKPEDMGLAGNAEHGDGGGGVYGDDGGGDDDGGDDDGGGGVYGVYGGGDDDGGNDAKGMDIDASTGRQA